MTSPTTVRAEHLDFALRLHRGVAGESTEQSCFSPYSVGSALLLAARGAEGTTREQILDVLGTDIPTAQRDFDAAAQCAQESSGEQPVLAVANTVWTREDVPIREEFQRAAGAAVRHAPFTEDPERARQMINADVAETTRELIPELVPEGAIDPSTVAALVNALYLKVAWRKRFPAAATQPAPFEGAGDVPTMKLTESLGYAARDGWQAVSLAATGGVEAVVLLPDAALATAEGSLTTEGLQALLDARENTRVQLEVPSFAVRESAPLTKVLARMGAEQMFTEQADFSALSPTALYVSAVQHEAVLRVDEEGFEGAAATAVMMKMAMAVVEPDPIVVKVDRPFLFLVRQVETGVVYFLARITEPE